MPLFNLSHQLLSPLIHLKQTYHVTMSRPYYMFWTTQKALSTSLYFKHRIQGRLKTHKHVFSSSRKPSNKSLKLRHNPTRPNNYIQRTRSQSTKKSHDHKIGSVFVLHEYNNGWQLQTLSSLIAKLNDYPNTALKTCISSHIKRLFSDLSRYNFIYPKATILAFWLTWVS